MLRTLEAWIVSGQFIPYFTSPKIMLSTLESCLAVLSNVSIHLYGFTVLAVAAGKAFLGVENSHLAHFRDVNEIVLEDASDFSPLLKMSEAAIMFNLWDLFSIFSAVKHQFKGLFSQLHKA